VNPEFDLAVQSRPRIIAYLQQEARAACNLQQSRQQLMELIAWITQLEKVIKAQAAQPKRAGTAAVRA